MFYLHPVQNNNDYANIKTTTNVRLSLVFIFIHACLCKEEKKRKREEIRGKYIRVFESL